MALPRVFVTGIGAVSAIGLTAEENRTSLLTGKHGIAPVQRISTKNSHLMVGEVKLSDEEILAKLGNPEGIFTRTSLLGMLAAKEALAQAGIEDCSDAPTGLISSTSVGGMGKTENYYYDYLTNDEHLEFIITHDCGDSTECLADYFGIKDYLATISTACSSAANAVMMGARLIKSGQLDRVVVGGTDCLTKFTLNGFNTLMILDAEHSRPFDQTRRGLNLGEGAGFLVLESEELVRKSGKKALAEVSGYGNANDAHHQTASSPEGEGAFLAMSQAFQVSGLEPSAISYINVHGTGTENNDQSEGTAINRIYEGNTPPFSSVKAFTGHTLAAAGGLEAVYSVMAIDKGCIYPNLNFQHPIEGLNLVPETEGREGENIQHVLSNSFGFGGIVPL
ncbi:beta-ketoacyl-[acyl-carrier-protein] synthase family protein [bacterium SCSIO 12741]|nr:beta-ketoacyl-[acyl-carrier-protein] synthase family protein [bacterium SCSIO 12741]